MAQWLNSVWDCCSPCGDCWMAACCPCILHGETAQRLDPTKGNDESKHSTCNGDCGLFCLAACCGCGWIMTMMRRSEIRNKFGIEGGAVGDCCLSFCCGCCAELQLAKETKQRLGGAGAVNTRGYAPQPGMSMEYQQSPPPQHYPAQASPQYQQYPPQPSPQYQQQQQQYPQ